MPVATGLLSSVTYQFRVTLALLFYLFRTCGGSTDTLYVSRVIAVLLGPVRW
jgi:hypothetical protein